jgi:hypothetical protein
MARFVNIETRELEGLLEEIGEAVTRCGGSYRWSVQGTERLFVIAVQPRPGFAREVKVFTTLSAGASEVRECGADAIRVIPGALIDETFKPLSGGVKVLRTAPRGEHRARVAFFLGRLKGIIRQAYKEAGSARACPVCGSVMVERKGRNGAFLGCSGFPGCRHTQTIGR